MKTHKELIIWQKSMDFVVEVYRMTQGFPKEELFNLTSQMRRAAVSIPSNIAEGSARNGSKEFRQYLYIAFGSANELETQLILSNRLNYIKEEDYNYLNNRLEEIMKMLSALIKAVKHGG